MKKLTQILAGCLVSFLVASTAQAAGKLNIRQAFVYVTLPLLLPGIVAGYMLAFIISLDDFIITNFVAGPGSTTLPLAIYGLVRTGLTPEINAVSTLLLCVSIVFVSLSYMIGRKRDHRS